MITTDDCDDSECTILCRDIRAKGLNRIYLNPGVRVGYNPEIFSANDLAPINSWNSDSTTTLDKRRHFLQKELIQWSQDTRGNNPQFDNCCEGEKSVWGNVIGGCFALFVGQNYTQQNIANAGLNSKVGCSFYCLHSIITCYFWLTYMVWCEIWCTSLLCQSHNCRNFPIWPLSNKKVALIMILFI